MQKTIPDHTAVRVALWRALHLQIDALPHILEDDLGLQLVGPEANWQQRPDMHPDFTRPMRASIVARARFIEDIVAAAIKDGVHQYVILGAGLDTFALRRKDLGSEITVYEIEEPDTQEWKKQRLTALGIDIPNGLRFVPVDFEKDSDWRTPLINAGFDTGSAAVISCAGVSMYLTHEAVLALLRQVATLTPHATLVMTFLLPTDQLGPEERSLQEMAMKGAAAAGTPFISLFTPARMLELSAMVGLRNAKIVSGNDLSEKYFAGRKDGLSPLNGEHILVATT